MSEMNEPHPSAVPPTPPTPLPPEVRNWALGAHLSAFLGLWFFGLLFLGPLVVWLIKRESHPFIEMHAREALNFNISVMIYAVVSAVLMIVLIGFVLVGIVLVAWLVLAILAAVKAANGETYRYPLTIRFVS